MTPELLTTNVYIDKGTAKYLELLRDRFFVALREGNEVCMRS